MKEGLQRKRGPLPTWAWIVVAVGAVLAYRYWRSRSSTGDASGGAAGPPNGLQPIGSAAVSSSLGSPIMSSSAVSPPTANGVGSSTVGTTALHAGVVGDAATGGPPHTEPIGTVLGYGETTTAPDLATLKSRQPSWGVPSSPSKSGRYRVVYTVGTGGFKNTYWEAI